MIILNDSRIVSLFFARSETAITELMDKYGRLCRKIARGILHSEEDTEECINSACMQLWNAIPPKKPEDLGGYFAKTVRNEAISEYRRNSRRIEHETDIEFCRIIPDGRTVEDYADANSLSAVINDFLAGQTARNRRIFVGRYYFNLSVADIAASLGLSESAVKSRLFRQRNELKEYLREKGGITV